jgi:hypothetical protein
MQTALQPQSTVRPFAFRQQAWQDHRLLTLAAFLHVLLIPIFVIAWIVDPTVISGTPAWIKPLKFAISGGIYLFTFAWLVGYVTRYPRTARFAAHVTGLALVVETVLIATQVLRGTTSHFNNETPLDTAIFQTMGGFIMVVAVLNLLLAIWLLPGVCGWACCFPLWEWAWRF